uniref:Antifreeze protein n=1 Tax=Panagrolaimus sp. ES5 TaxID=591445 RepID=A0AC34G0K3_9BILA
MKGVIFTVVIFSVFCYSSCQDMRPSDAFCVTGNCANSCSNNDCSYGGDHIIDCTGYGNSHEGLHCYKPLPGQYCYSSVDGNGAAKLGCNSVRH